MRTNRRSIEGYPPLYMLSTVFFVLALTGVVALLVTDIVHHLSFSPLHAHLDAWPLTAIGLSYIILQFAGNRNRADQVKGIFLGIAFLLWGGEQLVPPSQMATVMDEGAITIFVVDVSFIIWSRISLNDVSHLP